MKSLYIKYVLDEEVELIKETKDIIKSRGGNFGKLFPKIIVEMSLKDFVKNPNSIKKFI